MSILPSTSTDKRKTVKPASANVVVQAPITTRPDGRPITGKANIPPVFGKPAIKTKSKSAEVPIKSIDKLRKAAGSLVGHLILSGLLAAGLLVGIFWVNQKLEKLTQDIEQKRGLFTALSQQEENYRKLEADLNSAKSEIALLDKALPNETGLVDFLTTVERLKAETDIAVSGLSFAADQPQKDKVGNDYIELAIEASGTEENLEKYLNGIFKLPLVIRAKLIQVDKFSEAESFLILKAWVYVDNKFFLKGVNEKS